MYNVQILLGTAIITVIVIFHVTALVYLARWTNPFKLKLMASKSTLGQITLIGSSIFAIISVHTIEAWAWAWAYYKLGEFNHIYEALYFSVVTSTTLGFGDITLSSEWQLLSAFEAMGGLLLYGFSTAFLISLIQPLLFKEFEQNLN